MMNSVNAFFRSIYSWMAAGVFVSGIFAWLTMNSFLIVFLQNPVLFYGAIGIELALVIGVQWMINRISSNTAFIIYFIYAALNGVTMAGFLFYFLSTNPTVALVIFGVAISMFAALAVLGYTTKFNLSGWGTFLFMAVWGILFSSIANIFLQNDFFSLIISAVALLVFSALTVYDNQYYKNIFAQLQTEEEQSKAATIGALHMYINFIMIFQSLLNLFGRE